MSEGKQQGHLDGLCGAYAVVNAFLEVGVKKEHQIFQTCCRALPHSRWPDALWEGTELRDLERMIKRCREEIRGLDQIKIYYPFRAKQPKSNSEFWPSFDGLFKDNPQKKCAIVGVTKPAWHWLVAVPEDGAMKFIDSNSVPSRTEIPRDKIYAGRRPTNSETHCIVRKEVIIFEKVA